MITVRVSKETKEKLEFLSRILNVNVSELLRKVIVPISEITETIKAMENVEKTEGTIVQMIIESKPFQEMLEKLSKYQETVGLWKGFHDNQKQFMDMIVINGRHTYFSVFKENGKYELYKVKSIKAVNQYGDEWTEYYQYSKVITLKRLIDFLDTVRTFSSEELRDKIKEIKENLKKIVE